MSSFKYIIGLAVLVAVLFAVNTEPAGEGSDFYAAKSHNFTAGRREFGDRLVLRDYVTKSSSWMKVVVVEKTFNISKWERITMIEAIDQQTNGTGAYASIIKNGLGHSNVTMRFKSQRGHSIKFIVQLYGR